MELVTRPQFYLDVIEEVEYLASQASPQVAARWHRALDRTIQQLLRNPYLGRQRNDLKPRWNSFLAGEPLSTLAHFLYGSGKRGRPVARSLWHDGSAGARLGKLKT